MPSKVLLEDFRRLHAEHQEKLYEQSRKGLTIQERRKEDKLEQAMKPKQTFEDVVEKAKLIMPQIVNEKAWSDQGRINMPEMMKLLKVSQNTVYRVRRELLKEYHAKDQERDAQNREPEPSCESAQQSSGSE